MGLLKSLGRPCWRSGEQVISASPALGGLPLLEDLGNLEGKRVLLRADFNVPLKEEKGELLVADDLRIRSALPTIEYLQRAGATVVCCSHLGRPKGVYVEAMSLKPVAQVIERYAPGVTLMENLRFNPGEIANDPNFVSSLIEGFDAYVNDAFGASHRSHASVVGPPHFLPSAAGRLLEREVAELGGLLHNPDRPFVVFVGGSKVSDKLGFMKALARHADRVVVGGGMAFTFLAAQGRAIGNSLFDESRLEECKQLLQGETPFELPTDIVALEAGASFGPGCSEGGVEVFVGDIPEGWMGLDIGPASAAHFADLIASAGTVLWNGPMGAFEDDRFNAGTEVVALAIANTRAMTVAGGGDSARAVEQCGVAERVDFLSTGGGASLELLEFGDLPALAALRSASNAPRI